MVQYYDTVFYCRLNHWIKTINVIKNYQYHRQKVLFKVSFCKWQKNIFTPLFIRLQIIQERAMSHLVPFTVNHHFESSYLFYFNASTSFLLLMFDPISRVQVFFTWWLSQWWLTAVDNDFISMVWLRKIFFLAKRLLF